MLFCTYHAKRTECPVQDERGNPTMARVLGVTEVRSRFGEIVDKVQYQGDMVVLKKKRETRSRHNPICPV